MALAVVTGASSGIGRATAKALAGLGYDLVLVGRSEKRTRPVIDEINASGRSAEFLHLDLASLESARIAANTLKETGRTVDVLVNNAGIGATRGLSQDGFEIHFAVNHLGHFEFTRQLENNLRPGSRIVQVSSDVHHRAPGIDWAGIQKKSRSFYGLGEYAQSKLANILFVVELARRRPDWRCYAVHPGLTDTNIIPRYIRPFLRSRLLTAEQGADTVVWCATSEEVADETGGYYARRRSLTPSEPAGDEDLALRLWEASEGWRGVGQAEDPR